MTIPDYVMVPKTPDGNMRRDGKNEFLTENIKDQSIEGKCQRIYQAMIDAAPPSPRSDRDDPYTVQCTDNGFLGDVLPAASPRSDDGEAKPVAWRWLNRECRGWFYSEKHPGNDSRLSGFEPLYAAPRSPSQMGSTPHSTAVSAALRAQVIEECASELDRLAKEARIAVANFGVLNSPKDQQRHLHEASGYDRAARAIRSLSAERDVGEMRTVPYEPTEHMLYMGEGHADFMLPEAHDNTREGRQKELRMAYQVMLDAFTTSPSAMSRNAELERLEAELHADINDPKATVRKSVLLGYMAQVCDLYHAVASEAPTSADAVNPNPPEVS